MSKAAIGSLLPGGEKGRGTVHAPLAPFGLFVPCERVDVTRISIAATWRPSIAVLQTAGHIVGGSDSGLHPKLH
jgi:hypothetical protein